MFMEALLVFKSYRPLKLEKGMYFLVTTKYDLEIIQLQEVPRNEEEFLKINGYPVEPYIIDKGNPNIPDSYQVLANPEEIGWMDEGEHTDELCDIEVKHFNRILSGYEGEILIEMVELEDNPDYFVPGLYQNKVTIKYADDATEEFTEENYDDEYQEYYGDEDDDPDQVSPEQS